jgi:uncharacterized protein (TIGR02679 family)
MSLRVDPSRLEATLGLPELSRLLDALQRRIELGRRLDGVLTLTAASPAERAAIDALFGRKSTRGATLRIDLDLLAGTLREAGICDELSTAVRSLRGVIVDRRALEAEQAAVWAEVWRVAAMDFAHRPVLHPWLTKLERLGLVRRLCGNEPAKGATLLRDLARVADALPAPAEPLAAFAAGLLGDAHALDPGTPRATLAVRAAARLGGVHFKDDAEGRRAAWASVGVMCDELSTPVLVYNLASRDATPLGRLLRAAKDEAEPLHLSLRVLLRWPLGPDSGVAEQPIHVCENPTIVTMAVARLGRACAPLVCVNGQFATPALVLLRQLRAAGARLYYHGDFDPAGLAIARRVMTESGARPWRFGAADYIAAPKAVKFIGGLGPTPWDPALSAAMRDGGRVVHEEAVFETLAQDLARSDREIR